MVTYETNHKPKPEYNINKIQDELEKAVRISFEKNRESLESGLWLAKISRELQGKLEEDAKALHRVLAENYYFQG